MTKNALSFFISFFSHLFIQYDPVQVNTEHMDIEYIHQATHITIWDRKRKHHYPGNLS